MPMPAVFLDRDGTVNVEVGYLATPEQVQLLPGAAEAIRLLNENGFLVVITTNQSGVARGCLTETDLAKIHQRLRERLAEEGARVDGIYYCPHHPAGRHPEYRRDCLCRKPQPGLLQRAALEHAIDLASSYIVGDKPTDIEMGKRLSCKTVLVLTGYGSETVESNSQPDYVADGLGSAVQWILRDRHVA